MTNWHTLMWCPLIISTPYLFKFKNDDVINRLKLEPNLNSKFGEVQAWHLIIMFDDFNDIQQRNEYQISLEISQNDKVWT